MTKILFLPVGIGLAHIGRTVEVARALKGENAEVMFGAGGDAPEILDKENLPYKIIPEFDRVIYDNKIKQNNWAVYTTQLVNKFVKAEVNLIHCYKPDAVIFDLRVTAKISSRITGVPLVSINNVDATKYYDYSRIKVPYRTFLGKFLSPKLLDFFDNKNGQKILKGIGPKLLQAIIWRNLFKFNLVLARYGKKPIISPYDLGVGDLTILADIPEYRPVKKLPKNVKLVGPIFWNGINKLPNWSKEVAAKGDIIYVTASGTGDKELFIQTLRFLEGSPYTIIATCGNTLSPKEVNIRYHNLYVTDYLPGEWIMQRAKLIIFPGGNATAYQALSLGVPQIGTPLHLDQEDNMNQLVRLNTGILLYPRKNFTRSVLTQAIDKIMHDKKYRENAYKISQVMKNYQGAKQAAKEILFFVENMKINSG